MCDNNFDVEIVIVQPMNHILQLSLVDLYFFYCMKENKLLKLKSDVGLCY